MSNPHNDIYRKCTTREKEERWYTVLSFAESMDNEQIVARTHLHCVQSRLFNLKIVVEIFNIMLNIYKTLTCPENVEKMFKYMFE